MEQSPADDTALVQEAPPTHRLGTLVGEGLSSTTMVQAPPPGVLSFRDNTVCAMATDPDPPRPRSEGFQILEDPAPDVPMSPGGPPQSDWLSIGSPEAPGGADLDAFLSPKMVPAPPTPVPMTPDRPRCLDVSMSSPSAAPPPPPPNPWDDDLIADLLSSLAPPLTAHPRYHASSCAVPAIIPKMTIAMGTATPTEGGGSLLVFPPNGSRLQEARPCVSTASWVKAPSPPCTRPPTPRPLRRWC